MRAGTLLCLTAAAGLTACGPPPKAAPPPAPSYEAREGAPAAGDAQEAGSGLLQGLWLGSDSGLMRRETDKVERYRIDGADGPASGVAVEQVGSAAFAVAGTEAKLELISSLDGSLVSEPAPFGT